MDNVQSLLPVEKPNFFFSEKKSIETYVLG